MADFNVGSAWVALQPSAKGFGREAKAKLASLDLTASVDLEADSKRLDRAIQETRAELAALNREKASPSIDLDIAVAEARAAELRDTLDDLSRQTATPAVTARTAEANRELAEVGRHLAELNDRKATLDVDADIADAERSLARLEAKANEVDALRVQPQVTADTTQARARLDELNGQLDALARRQVSPEVELQIARARQEAERIRVELARLGALRPTPQVQADIAAASAKLAIVNAQLRELDGKHVDAHVGVSGGGQTALILAAIVAGLGAIAAAAPAAAAALAVVAGAAGALGQGAAATTLGLAGIGDAVKELDAAEKSGAASSASSASKRASAAKQIQSAEASLAQAVEQANRSRITGDQQVTAARRAVADAVISANSRIASAERSVETANRARQYAQEALTEAVKDATRANRDLQLSVSGAALSEKRATLSLLQARERLANSDTVDPLERADLALSVQEAEQNLKEVQNRYTDLKSDQADWARTGVAGSKQVVAAIRGVNDANESAADAARSLTEAQVSGAREIADANEALSQAQQQAQWAQEDSARAVAAAQRQLADAYASSADSAAGGAKKSTEAYDKLSQSGKDFVNFLRDTWQPAWEDSTRTVADQLLPRLQTAMGNVLAMRGTFTAGLAESARVVGDLAVKGSELAKSEPFQARFASIMASNSRALGSYGDAGINLFGAMTDLYDASGPVIEEFARLTDYSTDAFESWILGARQSGELSRGLQSAGDTLQYVGGWIVDVTGDVGQFLTSLAPLGVAVLEIVRFGTDWIGWLSQLSPLLTSAVAGMTIATVAASKMGTALSGLAIAGGATGIAGLANSVKTMLVPSLLAATPAFTKFQGATERAGARLGGYVQSATGSATAGYAVGRGAQSAGSALTKLGSTLPVVGLALVGAGMAVDALTTSFDEGIEAMGKGGYAAQKFREELKSNEEQFGESNDAFNEWLRTNLFGIQTTKEFERNLAEQRKEWTLLQNAQYDAGMAQGNYEQALRESGPTSDRTKEAQRLLGDATARVADEQDKARRATQTATQALQDQQNAILGSINARLGYEQSIRSTKEAQQSYNEELRRSGPDSLEAQDALGRLQQAQTAQAEAAARAAAEEAKKNGVTDTSIAATQAYAKSVGEMVAQSDGELTPALQQMVQGLDTAGLAAAGATVKIDETGRSVATFPDGKTVVLNADPLGALTGLDRVKAALDLAPDHKTITVDALDAAARQTLTDLGYTIRDVDGKVQITANDDQARNRLIAFQAYAAWQVANPQLAADPAQAYAKMREFLDNAGRETGVPALDADPARADQTVREAVDRYNREHPTPALRVDTQQADQDVRSWGQRLNDWFNSLWGIPAAPPGKAAGGLVQAASGGHIARARGPIRGFPTGGKVRGPGTGTSDSIPAMLSNGEFVVRKRSVDAIGVDTLHRINAMRAGGYVHLARGGRPEDQSPSAPAGAGAAAPAGAAPAAPDMSGAASGAATAAASTGQMGAAMLSASTAAATLAPTLAGLVATQAAVTAGQQSMVSAGITPLAGAVTSTLAPAMATYGLDVGVAAPAANAALQASQLATQATTTLTAQNTAANAASIVASTAGMSAASQGQHAALRQGQVLTQASTTATAQNNAANNAAMASQTGVMSNVSQNHLGALRGAQGVTVQSTSAFADSWRDQMARTQPDSGRPVKWIIDFPMRSIVEAWNNLDSQFSLGKHVNPAVANFATGGHVSGAGGPTADRIPAMLSDGEFVVRQSIASRVPHFLNALNSGQAEAVQAAGGVRANPYPGFAAGGVVAAQQFAMSQNGKPYQWGGTGNPSWDCSGFMSGITHALRGENPFSGRLGSTSTMPWGGFVPGLTGAFTIGNSKRIGHMGGTLAGVNVESGSANGVHYGPPAVGADNSMFEEKWTLPQVGGVFVSGGAGGGGSFDPTPLVNDAFKKAFDQIGEVGKLFGTSPQVERNAGVATKSAEAVKGKALEQMMTMFAGSGLWGPPGAGADFIVRQISDAARAFGFGVDGATIGVATGLVESNLQNLPGGDRDSVGVFQQRPSMGWGSIAECMNVLHAAGSFFSRFPPNWRSLPPGDVAQGVQRSAFPDKYATRMGQARGLVAQFGGAFDNGGLLAPGAATFAFNGTRKPERVLDNVETQSYDTLTRLLGQNGVKVDSPALTEPGRAGATWNLNNPVFEQPVDVDTLMQRADFRERSAAL